MMRLLRFVCLFLSLISLAEAFSSPLLRHEKVSIVHRSDEASGSGTVSPSAEEVEEDSAFIPPVIQQIADERRQYQMNLGKAMDVLRRDMRDILTKRPGELLFVVVGDARDSVVGPQRFTPLFFFSHLPACRI